MEETLMIMEKKPYVPIDLKYVQVCSELGFAVSTFGSAAYYGDDEVSDLNDYEQENADWD